MSCCSIHLLGLEREGHTVVTILNIWKCMKPMVSWRVTHAVHDTPRWTVVILAKLMQTVSFTRLPTESPIATPIRLPTANETARSTEHKCDDSDGAAFAKSCPAYAVTATVPQKTSRITSRVIVIKALWFDFDVPGIFKNRYGESWHVVGVVNRNSIPVWRCSLLFNLCCERELSVTLGPYTIEIWRRFKYIRANLNWMVFGLLLVSSALSGFYRNFFSIFFKEKHSVL